MSTPPTTEPEPAPPRAGSGASGPTPLSARNPRVAELRRLVRHRRARREAGLLVLDGPTLLGEALDAGIEVVDVFVDEGAEAREEVAELLARATASGARAWAVAGGLARHVEVATPNGLAATARRPGAAPTAEGRAAALHLVLAGVADPGNAGTLLRTAEAVGATSVVLTEGSVDPWSPKVVRSSAGSVLRVPVREGGTEVLDALAAAGVALVGTIARGAPAPDEVDLAGPVALVLGSEAHGLPPEVARRIERWVALPMHGRVESLNVAVAGSVLAFEVVRQRSRGPAGPSATMAP